MVQRKNEEEHEKENSERWLLTYSDMITLLLALFIIMYGMSSVNIGKFKEVSEALGAALNNPQSSESQSVNGAAGTGAKVSGLDKIYKELSAYIKEKDLSVQIGLEQTDSSVIIHLTDTVLFMPDTAVLRNGSEPILSKMGEAIGKVYSEISHVTITGNTADIGQRDESSEAISWQLSVDRAVKVLNVLAKEGLPSDKLSIEGNSHYKPVASNDTEEGRAKNRRVEITISK